MPSLYKLQTQNKLKTFALMVVFLAIIFALSYFAYLYTGEMLVVYASLILAILVNISSFFLSDRLAIWSSGAYPADEEKYKELHNIVENIAIVAGIKKPELYIIPDSAPNAFATGRNENNAKIAVTEGLLKTLDKSELEAVIAHEVAHIKNRDILVMTVAVMLVGAIGFLLDFINNIGFSIASSKEEGENRGQSAVFFIVWILLYIAISVLVQILLLAVSRKREFLADASSALMTRYPEALAKALYKIAYSSKPMQRVSVATSHLFISDPYGAKGKKFSSFVSKLFATHPPVEERIEALIGKERAKILFETGKIE